MNEYHTSVLLNEAIESLQVSKGKKYIDATLGGGGHSFEIVKRGGSVLGIDVDEEAISFVFSIKYKVLSSNEKDLGLARGNFRNIKKIAEEKGFEKVSGILFDLGVSSHQLDAGERGFSFQKDAPLDMRMGKNLGVTAADLVNSLGKGELHELFTKFGEETYARPIIAGIIRARGIKKIETTKELANIVAKAHPRKIGKIHPATKVFQALRIIVNDELNNVKEALPQAVELLESKGRLVVISFHSLEDRIVKQTFIDLQDQQKGEVITKKPLYATDIETQQNNRSRSAKLRIFEKK